MLQLGDCVRIKATGFTKIILGIDPNDSSRFLAGINPIIGDPTLSSYHEDELEKVDKMDHSQDFNGDVMAIIFPEAPCPVCQEKDLIRIDDGDNYCKYRLEGNDLVVNHYDHDAYTYSFPMNFCHICGRPINKKEK